MEFDNNIPIYLQVVNDIKKNIITGKLMLGEKLPSGRDLALEYQINPNTASKIYKVLEAEEICFTKRGLGTFLTEDSSKVEFLRTEIAKELVDSFHKNMCDLGYKKEELLKLLEEKYN